MPSRSFAENQQGGILSDTDRVEVAVIDPAASSALLAELVASVPLQDRPAREFEVLCTCVNHAARWDGLRLEPRLAFLAFLVARLRYLQDECYMEGEAMRWTFGRLHAYSRSRRPGPINGLARVHVPQHGTSWRDDAAFYLGQLTATPT